MTISCAAAREAAAELALGVLDGAERAEVLEHVGGCPSCQGFVDEHNEIADLLPHLAPAADPPAGFERRVVRAFRAKRWRTARRTVLAVAAVFAVAAIVSVAVVRIIDADRDDERLAAPALHTVSMIGTDGLRVGRVTFSDGSPSGVAVYVDYAIPDNEYSLVLRSAGHADVLGQLNVVDGRGQWSGRADVPRHGTATLALQRHSDDLVVCRAELDA